MSRPTRLAAAVLAAVTLAAASGPAAGAAPGKSGGGKDTAGAAQSDHKPAGTGSGRKIG